MNPSPEGCPPSKAGYLYEVAAPLTTGEEGQVVRVESDSVLGWREEEAREAAKAKLWGQFQQTAAALTQMYQQGQGRDWAPFQTAAGSLTLLYKDSVEEQARAVEMNRRLGYQRAREDLVTWARAKRRTIRREELLAFLANNSPGDGTEVPSSQDQASNGLARLSVDGGARSVAQPRALPSLQEMLDLSKLEVRKRSPPSSPNQSDEEMDSPQSKKLRRI